MGSQLSEKRFIWVRFDNSSTPYIFEASDVRLKKHDLIVVDTENGKTTGRVLSEASKADIEGLSDIKPVLRKASQEDLKKLQRLREKEKEYFNYCLERIEARSLPMKLSRVELTFDEKKVIFYFVAETRVDFRELLKDLVKRCKTRIELRQIGARQEAAMIGGIGSCGRELCCSKFLSGFQRISLKMAKDQSMNLNPGKISGLCGKLKCCLAYEQEAYSDLIEALPRPGKKVYLEQGLCTVVSINVMNQSFIAKTPDRRFVKASVSDILTEEEYLELTEGISKVERANKDIVNESEEESSTEIKKKKSKKGSSRRKKKKRRK